MIVMQFFENVPTCDVITAESCSPIREMDFYAISIGLFIKKKHNERKC